MSERRVKVRPITIMAVLGAIALVAAGLFAWRRRDDSSAAPAKLPITLGSSTAATPSGAADIALAPVQRGGPTIFVAAPGLPALTGSAHAWRVSGAAPDSAAIARLGRSLGVSGDVKSAYGAWTMGRVGGPQLYVSSVGSHAWSWSYGSSVAVSSPPVTCARPLAGSAGIGADETVTTIPCASTTAPPVGVPDQASAERRARAVLESAGFDLAGWKVTSVADAYSATVTAAPVLEGVAVEGLAASVTFGAHGAVTAASGWFGTPHRADEYPLVGTKAAIAHLQKGDASGVEPMTGVTAVPELGMPNRSTYSGSAMTTETVGSITAGGSGGGSSGSSPGSSGSSGDHLTPVPTMPTMPTVTTTIPVPTTSAEPVTVTIDHAELVLEARIGTDGAMWLVPAYRLTASAGGIWTVLAIDRKFVAPVPAIRGPIATIEPDDQGGGVSTGSTGSGSAPPATGAPATYGPTGG